MVRSRIDQVYRSFVFYKFFTNGWGIAQHLRKLFYFRNIVADREKCQALVDEKHPVFIDDAIAWGEYQLVTGHFTSPLVKHLPGLLPPAAETSYFQFILPNTWNSPDKPICIHMAGTGDHYFHKRRYFLGKSLLKEHGIGSLMIENPYYGIRKPKEQLMYLSRSSLLNVSDIFVMGGSLMLESLVLLRWCEREGYGPLCLHGISMGGYMASLSATNWTKPIAVVPCLSWSTASGVFTTGVMSGAIDWDCLEHQLSNDRVYRDEISKLLRDNYNVTEDASQDSSTDNPRDEPKCDQPKPEKSKFPLYAYFLELRWVKFFSTLFNYLSFRSIFLLLSGNIPSFTIPMVSWLSGKFFKQAIKRSRSYSLESELTIKGRGDEIKIYANKEEKERARKEALQFMRGIMDECTHLKNFAVPVDTELAVVIAARDDAYVDREGVTPMNEVWPGCEVRFIDSGHITGYILHQSKFRKAIAETLDRHRKKYNIDGTPKNPQNPLYSAGDPLHKKPVSFVSSATKSPVK